jgi:hypothetical protein
MAGHSAGSTSDRVDLARTASGPSRGAASLTSPTRWTPSLRRSKGMSSCLGPYEALDDFRVAVIDNGGMPIEFIQTSLTNAEIWNRSGNAAKSQLYR